MFFLSDTQSELHRNCSIVIRPADLNVTNNATWCDWEPFGKYSTYFLCIVNFTGELTLETRQFILMYLMMANLLFFSVAYR